MKVKVTTAFFVLAVLFNYTAFGQSACDSVRVIHNPKPLVIWSPDKTKYLVNVQDTAGVYQVFVGNAGDTTLTNISSAYTNGNCCGLFRSWSSRNKMQVLWHPSGKFIICGVEKEFYQELLYTPYDLRLGWLQSGVWMDIWAVTPDGNNWYNLANTENGMTGPAFTPDGTKGAWAEALDSSNIFVDIFGKWKMNLSEFHVNNGVPSFSNQTDITPAGANWIEPGNFAPDGKSLLISSDIGIANAEGQDQFILDITTKQVVNLTNSPMIWDEHGIFSPDGSKILFMSSYPYRDDTNSYHTLSIKTEFMLMNPDGSGLQQLTHYLTPGYPETHPGIAAIGFFVPEDSAIYAISLVFPYYENWIIKFDGQCGQSINTGRDKLEVESIKLEAYPNPVDREVTIVAKGFDNSLLELTDVLGRTIWHGRLIDSSIKMDVSHLPAGMYFVKTTIGGSVYVIKLLKQ